VGLGSVCSAKVVANVTQRGSEAVIKEEFREGGYCRGSKTKECEVSEL